MILGKQQARLNILEIDSFEGGGGKQCDQMVRLFFNIWPFATMKISPIMSQICQSKLSILPNKEWAVKNLPKTCKSCQSGENSPNLVTLFVFVPRYVLNGPTLGTSYSAFCIRKSKVNSWSSPNAITINHFVNSGRLQNQSPSHRLSAQAIIGTKLLRKTKKNKIRFTWPSCRQCDQMLELKVAQKVATQFLLKIAQKVVTAVSA